MKITVEGVEFGLADIESIDITDSVATVELRREAEGMVAHLCASVSFTVGAKVFQSGVKKMAHAA